MIMTISQERHGTVAVDVLDRSYDIEFQPAWGKIPPEAMVTASLLPAMSLGADLRVEGKVCKFLLESLSLIQDIFIAWDASFRRISIEPSEPNEQEANEARNTSVGAFFSGGVDSFYTLLKHRDEITHLIFVHGFDVELTNRTLRDRISAANQKVAAEFGKTLVEVETNLRLFSNPHVSWEWYHGAALATIGHLLSDKIRRVYMPATHSYASLFPWGSHALLDPLWSSKGLHFVHDGAEATRFKKIASIASEDSVLKNLRVCWKNSGGAYNCGRCEKCLRTMTSLEVIGALRRSETFPTRLDLDAIRNLDFTGVSRAGREDIRVFIEQNLAATSDKSLARALRTALGRLQRPSRLRQITSQPTLMLTPKPYRYLSRRIKSATKR
jgi:hypothetical protein